LQAGYKWTVILAVRRGDFVFLHVVKINITN